jgi:hypothetical protein
MHSYIFFFFLFLSPCFLESSSTIVAPRNVFFLLLDFWNFQQQFQFLLNIHKTGFEEKQESFELGIARLQESGDVVEVQRARVRRVKHRVGTLFDVEG